MKHQTNSNCKEDGWKHLKSESSKLKSRANQHEDGVDNSLRPDLHAEVTSMLASLIATSLPGTKLPTERKLSESLGVGRSTVREAVRSLAFIGAVQVRQGDGIYVSDVDNGALDKLIGLGLIVQRSKVNEIIEVRQLLEVESAFRAAERYEEADRVELVAIMDQMTLHVEDVAEASRLDLEFHVRLAQASRNTVLAHFINGMRGLFELWINKSANHRLIIEKIIREHKAILEAVLARDGHSAAQLMTGHLVNASKGLLLTIGADRVMLEYISSLGLVPSRRLIRHGEHENS